MSFFSNIMQPIFRGFTQQELDVYAPKGIYQRKGAKFSTDPSQAFAYAMQYATQEDAPHILMLSEPANYSVQVDPTVNRWYAVDARTTPIDLSVERLFPRDNLAELVKHMLLQSGIRQERDGVIFQRVLADVGERFRSFTD